MRIKGCLYAATAGALWGFMGFFVRHLTDLGLSPMDIIFVKMLLGAAVMAAILTIDDRRRFRLRWQDLWCLAGSGLICIFGFNFFYYSAMNYMTLAVAVAILYTAPGFALVFSAIFLKEAVTIPKVIALGLIVGGCFLTVGIFSGGLFISLRGLLFALLGAICYGLYGIFGRIAGNRGYSAATITFYNMLFCLVGAAPFTNFQALATADVSALCLYGGGIAIPYAVVPYLLFNAGIRHIQAGEATMVASLEPVVATVVSAVIFKEPLTATIIGGILLILGGIALINLPPPKRGQPPTALSP